MILLWTQGLLYKRRATRSTASGCCSRQIACNYVNTRASILFSGFEALRLRLAARDAITTTGCMHCTFTLYHRGFRCTSHAETVGWHRSHTVAMMVAKCSCMNVPCQTAGNVMREGRTVRLPEFLGALICMWHLNIPLMPLKCKCGGRPSAA